MGMPLHSNLSPCLSLNPSCVLHSWRYSCRCWTSPLHTVVSIPILTYHASVSHHHPSFLLPCAFLLMCLVSEANVSIGVVLSWSSVRLSILFTRSFSCLSGIVSHVVSSIWASNNLKSMSDVCSLAFALSQSQSSLDQSDGAGRVVEHCTHNKCNPWETYYKVSWGWAVLCQVYSSL